MVLNPDNQAFIKCLKCDNNFDYGKAENIPDVCPNCNHYSIVGDSWFRVIK